MLPQLSRIKGVALDVLFPQRCLGCGAEGMLLCQSCQRLLPRINPPICPKCGKPQVSGIVCPACIAQPSDLEQIRAPFKFEGIIREAVHQFKYKNLRSLARPLAEFMADYIQKDPITADVIVPVPLHRQRLKERGYNQSELIARELSIRLQLPLDTKSLCRHKYMLPQAKTRSVEERRENVHQAFNSSDSHLKGKRILLIDDVSTSGATLEACGTALKTAGVKSIWGFVLAREI